MNAAPKQNSNPNTPQYWVTKQAQHPGKAILKNGRGVPFVITGVSGCGRKIATSVSKGVNYTGPAHVTRSVSAVRSMCCVE